MGCVVSKREEMPAVGLCRERSNLLEAAIRHRYALAHAHLSYTQSLKSLSSSLHRFFDLQPPTETHLEKPSSSPPTATARLSHSASSGSCRRFQSDRDLGAFWSPLHGEDDHGFSSQTLFPIPPHYYAHYARRGIPEALRFEESYPYPSTSYLFPSYSEPHLNYAGIGGFHSHLSPPRPPPAQPSVSTWDFLNPFETSVNYYGLLNEVSKKEGGVSDLGGYYQQEVVKEVDGSGWGGGYGGGGGGGDGVIGEKVVSGMEGNGVNSEADMVEKKVVVNEELVGEEKGNAGPGKASGMRGVSEVVTEIKAQFDRASESAGEVAKMLEVGKLPYYGRNAVYKVSPRMLDAVTPLPVISSPSPASKDTAALPSTTKFSTFPLNFEEDMMMNSNSLSSTLEKLYIWERKLFEEVRGGEKMRVIHERKCRRLKHLDESGAEAHKIESSRASARKLSTKIRMAFQYVDSISNTINKLRDEDLWLRIDELIKGLVRMWKVMLECHQNQCQIIREAENLNVAASGGKLSDDCMEVTMQFEQELLNWILSFYAWTSAMKSFVKALNGWLLMCIQYEPEETADGIAPFSPGRIGAPPVFVICNHWSQVMDRISEKEVLEAMRTLSANLLQLWNRYSLEQHQRMIGNNDTERRLKFMEREQKMQKSFDIVNKKLTLVSEQNGLPPPGQIVHHSHSASDGDNSLQSGLRQIFEAMARFSDNCIKAYEELCLRSEEAWVAGENTKVL